MSLSVVDHNGDHFEYLVNFFGYADNLWSSMNFYSEILVVQDFLSINSTSVLYITYFFQGFLYLSSGYDEYSIIYEFTNKIFACYNCFS